MTDAITLSGVTKTFGPKTAVRDLDLVVPTGALYGFIGPNGAGKTTTIRMIMSILFPDRGTIGVLGRPSALEAKDRIGYLPEERGVYKKMKVGAFLAYMERLKSTSGTSSRSHIRSWLERVGLAEVEHKKVYEGKPSALPVLRRIAIAQVPQSRADQQLVQFAHSSRFESCAGVPQSFGLLIVARQIKVPTAALGDPHHGAVNRRQPDALGQAVGFKIEHVAQELAQQRLAKVGEGVGVGREQQFGDLAPGFQGVLDKRSGPVQGDRRFAGTRSPFDQRRAGEGPVGVAPLVVVEVEEKATQHSFGVALQVLRLDQQLVRLAGKLLDLGWPQRI